MTRTNSFPQVFVTAIASIGFMLAFASNALAIDIKEIESKSGIKAYLVEDYTLPLVSMSFSFTGGMVQDPVEKTGLVRLMTSLLDEGAGPYDSSSYRARLEENGVEIGFSSNRESVSGRLRTVTGEKELGIEMLRLALVEPRFEVEATERMRNAICLGIERANTNPNAISVRTLRRTLFGDHPYARTSSGNEETIAAITRDDIVDIHSKVLAKDNLYVGIVGAINEADAIAMLDAIFSDLPDQAKLLDIDEASLNLGTLKDVAMPVPNTSLRLVYKGIKRDSPDFFAAHVMNHILGGGTFSSRLFTAVREKRGLAYGVSSGLVTLDHTAYLVAGTSTRADNQDAAMRVMRDVITEFAEKGISEEELEAAKKFIVGSYAINNLDTSGKIAGVLVALQSEGLGIDYIDRRADLINAVSREDVNRIARELLQVEPTVVTVGPGIN